MKSLKKNPKQNKTKTCERACTQLTPFCFYGKVNFTAMEICVLSLTIAMPVWNEYDWWRHVANLAALTFYDFFSSRYRYTAYRQLTRFVWGFLGKSIRVVLPACAVSSIRKTFPSEDGTYTGYLEPEWFIYSVLHTKSLKYFIVLDVNLSSDRTTQYTHNMNRYQCI